jgi:hypothetical protein
MKEDSNRESEPEKWAKWIIDLFQIRFWTVEFLSKFQSDPTVGSKIMPFFVKHTHIASYFPDGHLEQWPNKTAMVCLK